MVYFGDIDVSCIVWPLYLPVAQCVVFYGLILLRNSEE